MAKSKQTKKYSTLAMIFTILSILLFLGPSMYYILVGFFTASVVIEKIALVSAVFISLILTALCAINKWVFRSKIWIIVIAIIFVIDNYLTMILIFAISQVLDELIISPLAKYFRNKTSINREIDKRLGV